MFCSLEREYRTGGGTGAGLKGDIKKVIADLAPFFENSDPLEQVVYCGGLTFEHSFLKRTVHQPWVSASLQSLLSELREARHRDPKVFFSMWVADLSSHERATTNYGAAALLQGNQEELERWLQVRSCFRTLGEQLEGGLQPYVRLRLKVWEILGIRSSATRDVEALSFGGIIQELQESGKRDSIYTEPESGIRVSQIRNIALHQSFEFVNDKIVCSYGTPDNLKHKELTWNELRATSAYVDTLFNIHKVAHEIFTIDNAHEVLKLNPKFSMTDYSLDCVMAYGLLSSGFSFASIAKGKNEWRMVLIDNQGREAKESKAALQEGCLQYLMFAEPTHISALVFSNEQELIFTFMAGCQPKWDGIPTEFRGRLGHIESYLKKKARAYTEELDEPTDSTPGRQQT